MTNVNTQKKKHIQQEKHNNKIKEKKWILAIMPHRKLTKVVGIIRKTNRSIEN